MTFSELRDLMLLYVADLVDEQERDQIERWLATGDPVAAAVLAEARAILANVTTSLDPADVDPAMWDRLTSKLDDNMGGVVPAGKITPAPGGKSWAPLALAAAAALIAGVAVFFITEAGRQADRDELALLRQTLTGQEEQIRNLSTELTTVQQRYTEELNKLTGLRDQLAQQDSAYRALSSELTSARETINLLSAPELRTVQLAGTDERPDAVGRALWDADQRRLSFAAARLPAAEEGSTYQLWFVTDPDGPVSLGTFEVDADGRTVYDHVFDAVPGTIQAVAVSLEPAGGSPDPAGPTGPIVMVGAIQ